MLEKRTRSPGKKSMVRPASLRQALEASSLGLSAGLWILNGRHPPSSAHLLASQCGIQYPSGEMSGLTAVCAAAAAAYISFTGGWSKRTVGGGVGRD